MPFSRPSWGVAKLIGSPPRRISPASWRNTPEIALMIVDLPAPLSPASATTSPGWTSKDTAFSACTAPKDFETFRIDRIGSASLNLSPSHQAALGLVDEHRNDDDDADRDELPERLDIDKDETVLDDGDDERAGDRAPNRARSAEQAGAADDDRRDRIEQQRLAGLGSAGGEAAGVHRSRDAGHDRREQIDLQRQPLDVDPGAVRRRLAGAERVSVLTEARLRQHVMQDEAGDAGDDHQHRDPINPAVADRAVPVVVDGDGHSAGEKIGRAARNAVHAERADEGRDLQAGDEQAVDEAREDRDRRPAEDRRHHRDERRQTQLGGEVVGRMR